MTTAPPPPPSAPPPPPTSAPPPPVDPPSWQVPPPPPPQGPYPPSRPPLRRSATNRILGGVAGGLADYSGIDALIWRVGVVALTFAGGSGIAVYLLLWLLMPAAPSRLDGAPAAVAYEEGRRAPSGPRSPVPGITVAGVLIVVGSLALLTQFTPLDLGPRVFLAAALAVVGLGLVAAGLTGGRTARGKLIALGAFLSMALMAASTPPWPEHHGHVGDRTYHPVTAAEVLRTYDSGIGNVTVDLTDVELGGAGTPISTRVDGGVGNIRVLLPRSADVQLSVDQGIGNVTVFESGSGGGGFFPGTGSAPWTGDGRADIVLRVDSGIGNVEVSRG